MEFSNKIFQVRKSKSLNQKDMCSLLKVAKSTYCYYEKGQRFPDIGFVERLITTMGVNPLWLFLDEGEMFSYENTFKKIESGEVLLIDGELKNIFMKLLEIKKGKRDKVIHILYELLELNS